MKEEIKNFKNQDMMKEELQEAQRLGEQLTGSLKGKLIRWVIRWTIGFGIIAIVSHYKPAWQWLWYAGGTVAGLSLVMMLLLRQVVSRRLERVKSQVEETRRLADETD